MIEPAPPGNEEPRAAGQLRVRWDFGQVVGGRVDDDVGIINAILLGDHSDILALAGQDGVAGAIGRRDIETVAREQNLRLAIAIAPGDGLACQPEALGDRIDCVPTYDRVAGHARAAAVGRDGEWIITQSRDRHGLIFIDYFRRRREQVSNLRGA